MDEQIFPIIILIILIIMSAYFSAAETAFSSINKIRLQSLATNGYRRAQQVLEL